MNNLIKPTINVTQKQVSPKKSGKTCFIYINLLEI